MAENWDTVDHDNNWYHSRVVVVMVWKMRDVVDPQMDIEGRAVAFQSAEVDPYGPLLLEDHRQDVDDTVHSDD